MKHIKVFVTLFNLNIAQEMQFRSNFVIRLITQFFFVIVQVALIETYFRFTNSIGSWTRQEVFILAGIFRLIEGAFHILFHGNLLSLSEAVHQGDLDLYLTKPVNTLFLVSVFRQQWYELSTVIAGIFFLIHFLPQPTIGLWLAIGAVSFLGLSCLYAIMLMISSLSFYMNRFTAIFSIWDVVSKISRYPLDIFGRAAAPLLLIVTIPSRIVLGKSGFSDGLIQICGSLLLCIVAYIFWRYSLRHYSSASS